MKRGRPPKAKPKGKTQSEPITAFGGEIMTVQEVAYYMHCHYETIYHLARQGVLPVFKLGDHYRFRRADIKKWISQQRVSASGKISLFKIRRRRKS